MAQQVQRPSGDLGSVFDAHVRHEFVEHDVAATMRTMSSEPYVLNVPMLTGGEGAAGVREFYERYFVGKMPADTKVTPISRTVGADQVVDELSCRLPMMCRWTTCFPASHRPASMSSFHTL